MITGTKEKKKNKTKKEQLCNNVYLDNKLMYEKSQMRESADHDHPLQVDNKQEADGAALEANGEDLTKKFESVAIDWKPLRNTHECSCSSSFDHLSKKVQQLIPSMAKFDYFCVSEPL